MKVLPGPDFPTGGIICGRKGIVDAYTTGRGHLTVRAQGRGRGEQARQGPDHHHRNPLHGDQDEHRLEDRRMCPRRLAAGGRRRAGRVGPAGPADRRRAQERRRRGHRAQQAVAVHAAADDLRHCQYRPGQQPARDAEHPRAARAFHRAPQRGHPAAQPVPAEAGPQPGPHPRRPDPGGQRHRRDHRDHQEVARRADGQAELDEEAAAPGRERDAAQAAAQGVRPREEQGRAFPDRSAGRRDPGHAVAAADRPGNRKAGQGVRRAWSRRSRATKPFSATRKSCSTSSARTSTRSRTSTATSGGRRSPPRRRCSKTRT